LREAPILAHLELLDTALAVRGQVVEHDSVRRVDIDGRLSEEDVASELGFVDIDSDSVIRPVKEQVDFVPLPAGEVVDHAHKVHLLVLVVAEAEEGHIRPIHLGEIAKVRALRGGWRWRRSWRRGRCRRSLGWSW
jgi:hypothetical protein